MGASFVDNRVGGLENDPAAAVKIEDDWNSGDFVVIRRELGGSEESDPCFLFWVEWNIF